MILILVGVLIGALISVVFGAAGALILTLLAGVVLAAWCVQSMIELRDPYKVDGIPTSRVVREGWRRK